MAAIAHGLGGTWECRSLGGRWVWDGSWRFLVDPAKAWELETRPNPRPPPRWQTRAVEHAVLGLVAYPTVAGGVLRESFDDFGVLDLSFGGDGISRT